MTAHDSDKIFEILSRSKDDIALILGSLAHETRLQIIQMLCIDEREFNELMEATGLSKTALVHHLNKLVKSGVLNHIERGRYILTEDGLSLAGLITTFYETSQRRLGMTPSQFRDGGANTEIRFAVGECSLGSVLVAATSKGVCAISLGDDPEELVHDLQRRFEKAELIGADRGFEQIVAQVVGLVENPRIGTELPLDIQGSAFQQRVWRALTEIPPGETTNYAELARRIGSPNSSRAVANACGSNPLAVAIPCHRVVRSDGRLAGYRWGVERKQMLLDRESVAGDRSNAGIEE